MDLSVRDRKLIWHPFTQEQSADPPTVIIRGKGSYIFDADNNKLLDLVSSWWVNIHGHTHPEIARAIYEQALKLEHVIFAGFTHEPAVTLCESLTTILPPRLAKFFFSDNGSTAVEVALKMATQYWKNKGLSKNLFLSLEGGYHGDTWGAMSVGQRSGFYDVFSDLCFPVKFIPFPDTWHGDENVTEKEQAALEVLRTYLRLDGEKISAIIMEPLVQGASGMRMCRPTFVCELVELVRQHNILVIFDEVMTGFGRTGTYFAFEQINVIPDLICLSKGITGGFLPLALTVCTQEIYNMFLGDNGKTFFHGHSYTANPISCAAALASFKILTQPETMASIRTIKYTHLAHKSKLLKCQNVEHVRVQGTIMAFDVKETVDLKTLKEKCRRSGILVRPLHRSVYMIPMYSTLPEELERAYEVIVMHLNSY